MKNQEQIKLGARLLNISGEEANQYCHTIEGEKAIYISIPTKGGDSLIVGEEGQVLYANSSIGFDKHLEEYKNGRRTPLEAFNIIDDYFSNK